MWYVRAEWHGIQNCWYGAFTDRESAEKIAQSVNGMVYHESEIRAEGRLDGERHDQLQADTEAGDVSCQQGE